MRFAVIAFLFLICGNLGHAAEIGGQADPAFGNALEIWLSGDDAESLPALAELARHGNTAARLLLSEISLMPFSSSSYVSNLDAVERRRLFREANGKFGTPWLKVEADNNALARAILDSRNALHRRQGITKLIEFGELRKAGAALVDEISSGNWDYFIDLHKKGQLPANQIHLGWTAAFFGAQGDVRQSILKPVDQLIAESNSVALMFLSRLPPSATGVDEAASGFVFGVLMQGREDWATRTVGPIEPWILDAFEKGISTPGQYDEVRLPCERLCPNEVGECMRAAFITIAGHDGMTTWGTPLENLVSSETYSKSKRAEIHLRDSISTLGKRRGLGIFGPSGACVTKLLSGA